MEARHSSMVVMEARHASTVAVEARHRGVLREAEDLLQNLQDYEVAGASRILGHWFCLFVYLFLVG